MGARRDTEKHDENKEYFVSRIVAEAEREDVSLSEVERKMLSFSETG